MTHACDRRGFLSCGAYLAASFAALPSLARRAFASDDDPVVTTPFARVETLGDGLWAVVSTPMGKNGFQPTTVSNGGIVRGKEKTLVVEGFNTPRGAAWLTGVCKELTGRFPDYVVLTHFHGDHSAGLPGYQRGAEAPAIVATAGTRELLLGKLHKDAPQANAGETMARSRQKLLLPDTIVVDTSKPAKIDLGGRTVQLVAHAGHTPSDLTVVVDEPRTVFCGDLYFNGLFPYYGDAIPSRLNETVAALREAAYEKYVPGHGPVSDAQRFATYIEVVRDVERAARAAVAKGTPAAEAWKEYRIPERLGDWTFFRPDVTRFAFEAWERELKQ